MRPCSKRIFGGGVLTKMDDLLLDLPTFAVGAHGLIVGAVLLTVTLYLDRSYVDGAPL